MSVHLVTGYAGEEHVTAADTGNFQASVIGNGKYVLKTGNMFAYEVENNNLIKIKDGDLLNQGRYIRIPDSEECQIENGEQSLKRNDLIVIRYSQDEETGKEKAEIVVLKGTAGVEPADPEYISGDLLKGALKDDFPLYRVKLDGISIVETVPMFKEKLVSLTETAMALNTHKNSADHDGRYYTEEEVDNLLNAKAPINHASTAVSYGGGTAGSFGHVKLSDVYNSSQGAAANSLGASQNAVYAAYTDLNTRIGWKSNEPASYSYGTLTSGYSRVFSNLGFGILGISVTIATAITSAGTYEIAICRSYRPIHIAALCTRCVTTAINAGISAYIGSDGIIRITTSVAIPKGTVISVAGNYCI